MNFFPFGMGLVIGVVVLIVSVVLRIRYRSWVAKIPGYIGCVISVLIGSWGYFVVRGWEAVGLLLKDQKV
ncbi:hypothetical protein LC087_13215 [Bacillus carboniphilus]|uniref:Uncharacterized protein n=1 Tax=Bacillus carboniphilus TaxID=86663 RepID=A0ABY9JQX1_9BACI|nr:hypothetical protein [Bacillus carboniphilus]WLR41799.1 hypothetical protein LC087_13215 [Bacillus carboniphilus]